MRGTVITAVVVAAVVGTFPGCSGRSGAGLKREYKMQVTVGSTTYWGMGAAKFAELAAKNTDGRVKIKPYYGGQLLKGAQLNSAQMVATGAIDCAFESTINTAPVIPEMNVFSLPFFINTFENLDRLEQGETGRLLFERMKEKGLQPLAWGENGFRQLTNSIRAVASPADLAGLRIRVVGSPIFIDIFRQLGADPVNMNWGDAVSAFQQGTVDGQENPVGILLPVQIHQYHRYATFWNYLADPLVLYWNKKQWEAFPEDIRTGLREAATEAALFEKSLCRAGLDDGTAVAMLEERFGHTIEIDAPRKYLESEGVEVTTLTESQRRRFQEALAPVSDKWEEKVGAELVSLAIGDMLGDTVRGVRAENEGE